MSKGTIIYYGNLDLPDKSAAANRVSANAEILKELGYNVVFIGCDKVSEYFDGVRVSDFDDNTFLEAYPNTSKRWFLHIYDIGNIKTVVKMYDDVKFIFLYNVPFQTLKRVKKSFKNTGIKIVYDCTEWNSFAEGNLIKRRYKKYDEYKIEKKAGCFADGMIVISSLMQNTYKNQNNNLLLLPPLVDVADDIWNQPRIKNDGFEFCFAGSPGNKECMDEIFSAFDALDNDSKRLKIIGIGKEQFCEAYPQSKPIVDNNTHRIVFMGYLSHKETVANILSCNCYIFVRNSNKRNEAGFPTKFAESFTCGVPIITTNVSDISDFADEDCTVLKNADVTAILDAMQKIISVKKHSSKLKIAFDYNSYVEKTREWLERI